MIQGYFGFSISKIQGLLGLGAVQHHVVTGFPQHTAVNPSNTCVIDLPTHGQATQVPRIPT
jgi:hypothetical protein